MRATAPWVIGRVAPVLVSFAASACGSGAATPSDTTNARVGAGGATATGAGGAAGKGGATGGGGATATGAAGATGSGGATGLGGAGGATATGTGGAGGLTGSGGLGAAGHAGAGQGGHAGAGQAGQGGAACAPVAAAPDVDPWSVRAPSAGFGGIVSAQNGPHSDVFLQSPAVGNLPANYVRVGARLDWGGTLVFFGLGADPASNVLDANDTGRELQVALYDPTRSRQPCAFDASCLQSNASCGNSITFLGWDPVQGGDECGHGAKVLASGQAGDALRLEVQPLQWNPDWNKPDCSQTPCGPSGTPVGVTFTISLRFVAVHVVEVTTEVTSQEAIDHPVTGQEFPTLYVAHGQNGPDLPLLLDAGGQTISLVTPANDGFFYGNFTSPAPWVSWQNANQDYGVGLAMDQGIRAFQGWRGDGQSSPYFHNVRAQIAFGLGAGKVVRGVSYLALGSFATVKGQIAAALAARPPFGVVDAPAAGATATFAPGAPLHVSGWALDTAKLAAVRAELDGVTVASLPVGAARPDVCAVYPGYDGCPGVGFAGDVPTAGLGPCPHLLRIVAEDADGNATVLGERVVQAQ
jgi:hypothetical protein